MSRSGYCDDLDNWDLIRWRGQVASATRGKRGQKLLCDLRDALESLPSKRLIKNELVSDGEVCAHGALGQARGIDIQQIDASEPEEVAAAFDMAHQLAQEIVYHNDELGWGETPEQRYTRMLNWVRSQIK